MTASDSAITSDVPDGALAQGCARLKQAWSDVAAARAPAGAESDEKRGLSMWGIVGVLGTPEVAPQILEALKRLECIGYDSARNASASGAIDHSAANCRMCAATSSRRACA